MKTSTDRSTDHCNLNLSKLHHDVAFGRSGGMIIWQPRIGCWYTDKTWAGESLGRYDGMSVLDIHRALGCSARPYGEYNRCFKQKDSPKIVRRTEQIDGDAHADVIETPLGRLSTVLRPSPNSWNYLTEKRPIETPEDMKIATWVLDNSDWTWDQERFELAQKDAGDLAAPTMYMPRVNVQDLYINTMGVEMGVFAIYEWDSVVDDYFRALHENHMRMIDVINESPVDIINFGDNLHGSTLSPALFEEYVLPAYIERCNKLHQAGKFVSSHWDGDVGPLLKYARTCGLDAIEAITPKPQGDVTLEDVKEALGDDIFLLDGIPAVYFDTTFPEDVLIECAERVIELFAPKLILGISDEISSTGDIERVRTVGRIVDDYNASIACC